MGLTYRDLSSWKPPTANRAAVSTPAGIDSSIAAWTEEEAAKRLEPIFEALAPGQGEIPFTGPGKVLEYGGKGVSFIVDLLEHPL